jgi:hypothetical protein
VTGWLPRTGRAATVVAAVLGPGVAAYTGVLLSDTAVPTWHEAHRELPYLFVSSAAAAAGGLGLALVRSEQARPARNLAMVGGGGELVAKSLLIRRLGPTAEPYQSGQASHLMEAAEVLTAGALSAAALGGRKRVVPRSPARSWWPPPRSPDPASSTRAGHPPATPSTQLSRSGTVSGGGSG